MPRALVVDDEVSLTAVVSRFLEGAGFDVDTARSGPECLQKAVSIRPDVVLLDIMMPQMDGYEVCRRLRRDPRTARATIVVLTARGQLIDRQIALRFGADAHIPKPFQGRLLVEKILQLLADRVPSSLPLGYQIVVLRLKEGVGATTLVTNLALALAQEARWLTIVADLVLQGGQVQNRLGLRLARSWQDEADIDPDGLAEHLVRHESGLFVLPTSSPKHKPATPDQVAWVLRTLREWYDYVVVDTPFHLGSLATVLLRSSSLLLVLVTPEPAALRAAQSSLATIQALGNQVLQVWPVLCDVAGEEGESQRVEEALGLSLAAILPWAPQECARAVANSKPVVLSDPGSSLAVACRDLARKIIQTVPEQPLSGTRR